MAIEILVPVLLFFGVSVIGTIIMGGAAAKLVEQQRKPQR